MQPRILIIAIRAIGDVVLITPILALLRKAFPDGHIAVLVDGSTEDVLLHNPSVDCCIRIDRSEDQIKTYWEKGRKWLRLIRKLRRERFDIVLDLFSGSRSAILSYSSGAQKRYGENFRHRGRGFLYNYPITIQRDGRHLVEQKLELVHAMLGTSDPQAGPVEIFLTDKEKEQGRKFFPQTSNENRLRVGIIPSAGSPWRVWPSERFAKLGNTLAQKFECEVVLLGGPDDRSVCRDIAKGMNGKPLDLSGKTTLRELMAVLGELDLVVSNVTGPMHIATALSKPSVIGIYGRADIIQYAPWGPNTTMVTKGSKNDASWYRVDYQRDYEWLCQVTVDDVLVAVEGLMKD